MPCVSLLYDDGVEEAVYFATFQEIHHLNVAPALILRKNFEFFKWISVCKTIVVFASVKHCLFAVDRFYPDL